MAGFQSPITIYQAITNIENKDYLLPAFQREFVWTTEQIERFFDSLMQGYPINSMLFWKVKGNTVTDFNFYNFLNRYIEVYNTHNELKKQISKDFYAILDGQQRLTSLYLGLCGSYAYHEYHKSWENNPNSFPERKLYLCITKTNTDEEADRKYLFCFEKVAITESKDLYVDINNNIWFRVGKILDLHLGQYDLDDFCEDNNISKDSKKMLRVLEKSIFNEFNINYYEEDEQNPDKAVNIFTRINSGGTYLSFSDIMFSLMVANWKTDARTEIIELVDRVNNKGFSINIDYVLKAFLFLYHKMIKSSINSFSKSFCKLLEDNWKGIRDSVDSLFDLLRSYGLDSYTLTSNNATLPILYYTYHKNIYGNFTTAKMYEDNRKIIKKWLFSVLLRQGFGSHSDSTLSSARKAFTENIEENFIEDTITLFPADEILEKIKRHLTTLDDDFIDELLSTQKDNKYCFSILAMLYPNLDYKNNNFHKDHMHPDDRYDELSQELQEKYPYRMYNSIVNLQMLDANENESKGKKALDKWVEEELKQTNNRKQFYEAHLIPDVDLTQKNFDEFYIKRKELLSNKLKSIL
ncbi:DUF262 domain-containing protein [Treponema sp. Marseille-Q4130]|uniref:DUF262 domain-containing protein n=1 Tax=Treponema sp. Marseille-Q4130 TaxID=2766702 RepID=UPI001651B8B8|nr:DUF262 domain-containing protein [Treponema sp. Marseille-Q4130]MBC6721029.1 DUF262 domain-containing protein [Treponema sp. Marseille-Q4130]